MRASDLSKDTLFRPQNHLDLNEKQLERIRKILSENVSALFYKHYLMTYPFILYVN